MASEHECPPFSEAGPLPSQRGCAPRPSLPCPAPARTCPCPTPAPAQHLPLPLPHGRKVWEGLLGREAQASPGTECPTWWQWEDSGPPEAVWLSMGHTQRVVQVGDFCLKSKSTASEGQDAPPALRLVSATDLYSHELWGRRDGGGGRPSSPRERRFWKAPRPCWFDSTGEEAEHPPARH